MGDRVRPITRGGYDWSKQYPLVTEAARKVRLSDIEPGFTCTVCGKRSADVRPDFGWDKKPDWIPSEPTGPPP
jgi:hypothetical protein